jgi:peptidoglycan/LPS O-acetylase OafA/YrhL
MDLLLVIRGLAAIAVLIWHAGGHQGDFPFINVPGRTAVWVFFGISGYVIAYGFLHGRYLLDRPGLKHFYLNRFLRIYPLFLALSLLGWLTMWIGSGSSPIEWRDLPDQFFGLQFNHTYVLNGVFWTLGLEIQFYAIAPVLMLPFFIESARWRRFAVAACVVLEHARCCFGRSDDCYVCFCPRELACSAGQSLTSDAFVALAGNAVLRNICVACLSDGNL